MGVSSRNSVYRVNNDSRMRTFAVSGVTANTRLVPIVLAVTDLNLPHVCKIDSTVELHVEALVARQRERRALLHVAVQRDGCLVACGDGVDDELGAGVDVAADA